MTRQSAASRVRPVAVAPPRRLVNSGDFASIAATSLLPLPGQPRRISHPTPARCTRRQSLTPLPNRLTGTSSEQSELRYGLSEGDLWAPPVALRACLELQCPERSGRGDLVCSCRRFRAPQHPPALSSDPRHTRRAHHHPRQRSAYTGMWFRRKGPVQPGRQGARVTLSGESVCRAWSGN